MVFNAINIYIFLSFSWFFLSKFVLMHKKDTQLFVHTIIEWLSKTVVFNKKIIYEWRIKHVYEMQKILNNSPALNFKSPYIQM